LKKYAVHNHLAECLVAKGINQSQLARRFELTRAHVSRLVSGKVQPSLGLALRMSGYFQKAVDQIFTLANDGQQAISRPDSAAPGNEQQNNAETTKGKSKCN
jgi:DNA-binding XRE family transcriptional regulator